MNIAIIGCGFVADYYISTLALHPELRLLGLMDRQSQRAEQLSKCWGVPTFSSLDAVLADSRVELVLNLTNPRDHYEVSKAALIAGKHVYSEKPLGMSMDEARELSALAERNNLQLSCAPCTVLSETAQTLWRAIREGAVGKVRLVYAEMDDGLVHLMPYQRWISKSGVPWPYKDEFEVGCTLEHAGYCLTWMLAWFGPATQVTSFASSQIREKMTPEPLNLDSPDFSVACIQFSDGVVARLTCSIIAPHNHALRIFGDEGVLYTKEVWDQQSPVYSRRLMSIRRKTFFSPIARTHLLAKSPFQKVKSIGAQRIDFARGPAEMAAAVREGRTNRLSNEFSLHANELALAIHHSRTHGATYRMTTSFQPMAPATWAA